MGVPVESANKSADFVNRWTGIAGLAWLAMTWLASKTEWIGQLNWAEAAIVGLFGTALLALLVMGSLAAYRIYKPLPAPASATPALIDRDEFTNEELTLTDLIAGQELVVSFKRFRRCIIRGPGQLRYYLKVTDEYCSYPNENVLVELPEGAPILGAVTVHNVQFIRCYFENITLINTPAAAPAQRANMTVETLDEWKKRRWGTS